MSLPRRRAAAGVRTRTRPFPTAAPGRRSARPRPPDVLPAAADLRPAVAVATEIRPNPTGSEFERSRALVLRWLEAHVGPLPAGFHRWTAGSDPDPRVEGLRAGGGVVRAVSREAGASRYLGVTLEPGAISGPAAWRVIVVLFRAGGTSYLRAILMASRKRLEARNPPLRVPGIVHWLARSPGLTDYGWRIVATPRIVENEEGVEGLLQLITSAERTRPVLALGLPPRVTNPQAAALDPWDLAHRTVGLAHVVVVTGPMTYALTRRVGRPFSVFGNAVRTYRPGSVLGGAAEEHPMALPDSVRRWQRGGAQEFALFLTREAARTSVARQPSPEAWLPPSLAGEIEAARPGPGRAEPDVHPVGSGSDGEPDGAEASVPAAAARAS